MKLQSKFMKHEFRPKEEVSLGRISNRLRMGAVSRASRLCADIGDLGAEAGRRAGRIQVMSRSKA